MKVWHKALWGVGGALGVAVFGTVGAVVYVAAPTSGPHIGYYMYRRTAVVIVGLQQDFTGPQGARRYRDGDRVVAISNAVIDQAAVEGWPVLYVANVGDSAVARWMTEGLSAKGSMGARMDPRLRQTPAAYSFTKSRADAFSNTEFDALLRREQVDHLIVLGLDAAASVNATIRGALNRGYQVTVLREGVATTGRKSLETITGNWRQAGASVMTWPSFLEKNLQWTESHARAVARE